MPAARTILNEIQIILVSGKTYVTAFIIFNSLSNEDFPEYTLPDALRIKYKEKKNKKRKY